jgi:ribonuclease HI/exonuclease III
MRQPAGQRPLGSRWESTGTEGAATRNLRIASWNMGTAREFPDHTHPSTATLLELAHRADILCLQETHLHDHKWGEFLEKFRHATGGGLGAASHAVDEAGVRSYTGVAFLFCKEILADGLVVKTDSLVTDENGRMALIQIEWGGQAITLANIYAPAETAERAPFFEELNSKMPADTENLILVGDFNCTLDRMLDSTNPDSHGHRSGRSELRALMARRGLQDAWRCRHPQERQYTGPVRSGHRGRIDMALVVDDLLPLAQEVHILPMENNQQHCPVLCVLKDPRGTQVSSKRQTWKLNPSALQDQDLVNHLLDTGSDLLKSTAHLNEVGIRLEKVRNGLIKETKKYVKQKQLAASADNLAMRKRLSTLYSRQHLLGDPELGQDEIHALRLRILGGEKRMADESLMHQRVQERLEADRPTKGFLKAARARAHRSLIPALKQRDTGARITTLHGMADMAKRYWGSISCASEVGAKPPALDAAAQEFFLGRIPCRATSDEAVLLGREISLSEFEPKKDADGRLLEPSFLDSLPTGRSPGEDGVPYEWYRALWPILGRLLVDAWNSAWRRGSPLATSSRTALVCLIYKGEGDTEDISNYRPISLLACEYKILARCLTRRLLPVLQRIISPDQTFGMPKRSIEQNIRVKMDLLHWCDQMTEVEFGERLPHGLGLLDVDFAKAFDSVSIDFLVAACKRFGLGEDFCCWIRLLYRKAAARIVVNGHICDAYTLGCGIRQGCPISPLLFIVVMETFAIAVREDPLIGAVQLTAGPGWPAHPLKIQQFADDLTLYFTGLPSLPRIRELLKMFGKATNLVANERKTYGIWYGPGDPSASGGEGIKWLSKGEQRVSLGILVGKDIDPSAQTLAMEERVYRALRQLRGLASTLYNRALLAQVKVVSTVVFYARVTYISPDCVKRMQKGIDDYIWLSNAPRSVDAAEGGRNIQRHVKASAVYTNIQDGGLPIQRLEHVLAANQAWAIRKWLCPKPSPDKYLPRFWISSVHWPRRLGFSGLLVEAPNLPPSAPLFYKAGLNSWRDLELQPVPITSRQQLERLPLWDNPKTFPTSSTMEGTLRLATDGIRYVGQVLPPNTNVIPYELAPDPKGLFGPPRTISMPNPRGWVVNVRKELDAAIAQYTKVNGRLAPPPAHRTGTNFVTFMPLARWSPTTPPTWITRIWEVPASQPGCPRFLPVSRVDGHPAANPHDYTMGEINSALQVDTVLQDPYGTGASDAAQWSVPRGEQKDETEKILILKDATVRDFYRRLNTKWTDAERKREPPSERSGLDRHLIWVESTGYANPGWFHAVFRSFRSRLLTSAERSLLWQVMHSDGRFGCRIRAEIDALERALPPMSAPARSIWRARQVHMRGRTQCPFCGPDREHPETDPGETMEHAYGTCPGLDELWAWAVATFLSPAHGILAAPSVTTPIQHPRKTRRPILSAVLPHILGGLLGVVAHETYEIGPEDPPYQVNIHNWWSFIRGSILTVLEDQRNNALRGVKKYNVMCVARPPLRTTQQRVLQRVRARLVEETSRAETPACLYDGILYGGVLGKITGPAIVLSKILGGGRIPWRGKASTGKPTVPNGTPQGIREAPEDWRRTSQPVAEAKHAYLFFDGACQGNPGPSAGGCILKDTDGTTILAQDSAYIGRATNNEAEYCGLLLGISHAARIGVTDLSIRGDSRLVIDHISGRARCMVEKLSPLLDRTLRQLRQSCFPNGVDARWIRRAVNAEADAAANRGLQSRQHNRRDCFFGDQ